MRWNRIVRALVLFGFFVFLVGCDQKKDLTREELFHGVNVRMTRSEMETVLGRTHRTLKDGKGVAWLGKDGAHATIAFFHRDGEAYCLAMSVKGGGCTLIIKKENDEAGQEIGRNRKFYLQEIWGNDTP